MTVDDDPRQVWIGGISLRLKHPNAVVGALLTEWGFDVGRSWIAGEPRTTPIGTALEGVWPQSYAYTRLELGDAETLVECLEIALQRVFPLKQQISEFVDSGGAAEFFVGWHFERNSGDVLSWQLLERLSQMRVNLSLDIYPEIMETGAD